MVILALYMVTFSVRWQERALVLSFGKIVKTVDTAGLNWKLPWPLQKVVKFDGRIRTLENQAREISTKDKLNIIVVVYINWRIGDVRTFYETFLTANNAKPEDIIGQAEKLLRNHISQVSNIFAEYNLSELITMDSSQFKLPEIERGSPDAPSPGGMLKRIKDAVNAEGGLGIEIIDVGIKQLGVPDEVTKSVFDRMNEERLTEVARLMADGQSQAESIIGRANSQATIIRSDAQAKAKEIQGEGDAQATQYNAKLLDHKSLADFLLKLETLRKTLNTRVTLVIDMNSEPFKMLLERPKVEARIQSSSPNDNQTTIAGEKISDEQ